MNESPCRVLLLPSLEVPSRVPAMCSSGSINHSLLVTSDCSGSQARAPFATQESLVAAAAADFPKNF